MTGDGTRHGEKFHHALTVRFYTSKCDGAKKGQEKEDGRRERKKRAQLMCSHTRTHVIPNGGWGGDPGKVSRPFADKKSVEEKYRSNDVHTNAGQINIKERKKGTSSYPGNAGHRIEKDIIDQRIRRFRNRRPPVRGERLCAILCCSHVAQQIELGDVRWLLLITLRAGFCFVSF